MNIAATHPALRALSVRQPFASLIISGRKTIELRTWRTHYRGPVLIIASAKPWAGDHDHLMGPMGVTIGLVEVVDCREFDPKMDWSSTCIPKTHQLPAKPHYSWVLANPRPVRQVPCKGMLNLFQPSHNLLEYLFG